MSKKIAVGIQGLDVKVPNWRDIVWGDPGAGVLGRVPKGIMLAIDEGASLLILSTGATKNADGVLEAVVTQHFALEHLDEIFEDSTEEYLIARKLLENAYIDTESKNTDGSVKVAVRVAKAAGIDILYGVSDETHSSRFTRDSLIAKKAAVNVAGAAGIDLRFCFADTEFGSLDDLVILEPAVNTKDVRPGALYPNLVIKDFFKVPADQRQDVLRQIDAIIQARIPKPE